MQSSGSKTPGNNFKIGLFASNCSGGIAATNVKERWKPSWENNLELAQIADEAGLEFMLPLARWAGYGGETDHNGTSYETLIWAAGLLSATKRIIAFSTLHVAMINPVFAAKQMVTADHIGAGRFGLNIVCGWNADEFGMLGIDLGEHNQRYELGQEWWDVVNKTWSETKPFDFEGTFFKLKNVRAEPKPISQPRPLIMNAGQSGPGLDFAVRNADYLFRGIQEMSTAKAEIKDVKARSKALGRTVEVFTNAYCVCRPTTREADEFHHYYAVENANEEAVENIYVGRGIRDNPDLSDHVKAAIKLRIAGGNSAYPLIGNPDLIANRIKRISESGFLGIAMGLVNYLDELPYFQSEVLPRLEKMGLRKPALEA
jgi:FMNH2-dependent dimethyl sulfone monooxygenase